MRQWNWVQEILIYYESIKRELKTSPIYECRCDERLKSRVEESTHLAFTESIVYYESIKRELKTKLIYECRCDERLKTKVEEEVTKTSDLKVVFYYSG